IERLALGANDDWQGTELLDDAARVGVDPGVGARTPAQQRKAQADHVVEALRLAACVGHPRLHEDLADESLRVRRAAVNDGAFAEERHRLEAHLSDVLLLYRPLRTPRPVHV